MSKNPICFRTLRYEVRRSYIWSGLNNKHFRGVECNVLAFLFCLIIQDIIRVSADLPNNLFYTDLYIKGRYRGLAKREMEVIGPISANLRLEQQAQRMSR
jgi:hypothetical protein